MSEARSSMLGRRQWLAATAATLVVAFDPVRGVWLSRAQAHDGAVAVPDLDGELVFEAAALEEAADDFGHIVHDMPWAVLRACSSTDVQRMVRFVFEQRQAHHDGLTICMRGQAHSTHGQAQAIGV